MTNYSEQLVIPESFPNDQEELTLKLILSTDEDFLDLWESWKSSVVFEDLDFATLRILPLLYLRLKSFPCEDSLVGKIKGAYKMAWVSNQRTLYATANVLRIFEQNNIPAIILKGLPLLISYYKDIGARLMGDADILVKASDVKTAVEILRHHGWQYADRAFSIAHESGTDGIMSVTKETNFRDAQGNEIDLHWGLFHSANRSGIIEQFFGTAQHPLSFEDLQHGSISVSVLGASCAMPSNEDSLLHIVAHGSLRNDHRAIRWIADAAAIIRNSDIDWDRLLGRAERFGLVVEMKIALPYLRKTFGIEIDEAFLDTLAKTPVSKSEIRGYYRNANGIPYTALGAFPLLWRNYWIAHATGPIVKRISGFIDYLANAFGLANRRDLPKFVFDKYKERVGYFAKRLMARLNIF